MAWWGWLILFVFVVLVGAGIIITIKEKVDGYRTQWRRIKEARIREASNETNKEPDSRL